MEEHKRKELILVEKFFGTQLPEKHFEREQDYAPQGCGVRLGDKRNNHYYQTFQFAASVGCILHVEAFDLRAQYGRIHQI